MTRVVFFPECSYSTGLGHVVRCLALAHMLRPHFRCHFGVSDGGTKALDIIRAQGFEGRAASDWKDFERAVSDDLVVLDGYSFGERSQAYWMEHAKVLVCIADSAEQRFCAHAVINHSEHAREESYRGREDTEFYLGADYALLRPEFVQLARQSAQAPDRIHRVLVSMGGADPHNQSLRLVRRLFELHAKLSIELVLGPLNKDRAEISRWLSLHSQYKLEILSSLSAAEMAAAFQRNDLLIVTASGLAWEACAAGKPLVTCVTADNQLPIGEVLGRRKLAVNLGWLEKLTDDDLESRLRAVFSELRSFSGMVRRQDQLIDGRSPERLIRLFKHLEERR